MFLLYVCMTAMVLTFWIKYTLADIIHYRYYANLFFFCFTQHYIFEI